ncbi:MAG: SDR family oxidoreductase [Vulcanimicrobiaceae bacterium]
MPVGSSNSRRALVTGAASGLCVGVAVSLARHGFSHVAMTHFQTPPDRVLAELRATGATASSTQIDFFSPADEITRKLAAFVQSEGPFDTLVHGVGPLHIARFAKATVDEYRAMFDGNVRSAMLALQAVLPAMRAAQFGRIVLFGMHGSAQTQPMPAFGLHLAAKSALVALGRTIAVEEAANGITLNMLEPGDIREKDLPREAARARGIGSFEDIADAVRFFVAAEASFVTGSVLAIDGGVLPSR